MAASPVPQASSRPTRRRDPLIDGLLLVDKPAGVTSHDVVMRARRGLGVKRIGHAGTLDPFATGLLVLLVGRATRLLPHVDGEPKVYEATIRFGAETDTEDLNGQVIREGPRPDRQAVLEAILALTGEIEQVPPIYSAKRIDGQRAYDLARAGAAPEMKAVRVHVHSWEVLAWRDAECDVRITCGGGTYVRSLARDLGRAVGSAAHLTALRRVRSGAFDVTAAIAAADLHEAAIHLRPSRDAVSHLPAQVLSEDEIAKIVRGIDVAATESGGWAALVDPSGTLVALAERERDRWRPRVVLRDG